MKYLATVEQVENVMRLELFQRNSDSGNPSALLAYTINDRECLLELLNQLTRLAWGGQVEPPAPLEPANQGTVQGGNVIVGRFGRRAKEAQ